jgi:putative Mn2+ efflux pump MntP
METIILENPNIINNIWGTISPYWFSFIGSIPIGLGVLIGQLFGNNTIAKLFRKENEEIKENKEELKELKERINKLEKRR